MITSIEETKKATTKLLNIKDELELIDLLKEFFSYEYKQLFEDTLDEKIRIAKEKYWKDYDIRKYSIFLFKFEIKNRYGIEIYYDWLDVLKVIVFYENILNLINPEDNRNDTKNDEISKHKIMYNLFKELVSGNVCSIANHKDALKALKLEDLKQDDFDKDVDNFKMMHDFFARRILEAYLQPFIDRFLTFI